MPTTSTIILDIMNALQALNATIATVKAPEVARYPTAIDTASTPFAMTWPSGGEGWQKGAGYSQDTMTYRVLVYIDPVAQSDVPSHAAAGALLLQQFWNLYMNSLNTPIATPPPYQATIQSGPSGPHISHGGLVSTLQFRGTAWFGFELTIPVRVQFIQG